MTKVLVLGGSGMLGSMVVDLLSRNGTFEVTATVRDAALAAHFDAGNAVAVDGSGRPVVTGSYRLGGDFGGTALGGAGMDDIFLVGLR